MYLDEEVEERDRRAVRLLGTVLLPVELAHLLADLRLLVGRVQVRHLAATSQQLPAAVRVCWWRGTEVERRSLTGELSLSCARPAADG